MITYIPSCEHNIPIKGKSVFLAGPSLRGDTYTRWRAVAEEMLKEYGFDGTIISPEYVGEKKDWSYEGQVEWETKYLNLADVILFWIPRDLRELPGFTTNIEFGEWFKTDKVILGSPTDAVKMAYLKHRAQKQYGQPWYNTLHECIGAVLDKLSKIEEEGCWFTSDTHFGAQRTLELSKRPFKDVNHMDRVMIDNWNRLVKPNDVVWHTGDFGELALLNYLNYGQLNFIRGNYETDEILEVFSKQRAVLVWEKGTEVSLGDGTEAQLWHEPSKRDINKFSLFGHIHKLSMVKKNALNISVDCHDFSPISCKRILFYKNAIQKHYDNDVFCE
jgi:calcineurin-like phosphoesterase family protein